MENLLMFEIAKQKEISMKKSSFPWIRLLTLLLAVMLLSGCVPAVKTAEPTPQPVPDEPSLTLITE